MTEWPAALWIEDTYPRTLVSWSHRKHKKDGNNTDPRMVVSWSTKEHQRATEAAGGWNSSLNSNPGSQKDSKRSFPSHPNSMLLQNRTFLCFGKIYVIQPRMTQTVLLSSNLQICEALTKWHFFFIKNANSSNDSKTLAPRQAWAGKGIQTPLVLTASFHS